MRRSIQARDSRTAGRGSRGRHADGGVMAVGAGRTRAAVVGAGHMGQYHGRVYAELWDVDLVGIVDIDPARAAAVAAQYEATPFGDHRDLIGRVDVASVAVPTEQHFHVARDLLEAALGWLVDK